MSQVVIRNANKKYGDVHAVKDVNLQVRDKEFMVFVGPSGCGKTTTLRMIAGLEDISEGDICIGGQVINDVAPKNRDIAMVFQSHAPNSVSSSRYQTCSSVGFQVQNGL